MENNEGFTILKNLLNAFNKDAETVLKLFTQESNVEFPYAKDLGLPYQMNKKDYGKHLNNMLGQMPDILFTGIKVSALQEADWYWGEFQGETTVPRTGAAYKQNYVVNFKLENGKFSFYKEYWNVLPVLQSLMAKEEAHRIIDNPIK